MTSHVLPLIPSTRWLRAVGRLQEAWSIVRHPIECWRIYRYVTLCRRLGLAAESPWSATGARLMALHLSETSRPLKSIAPMHGGGR